MIQINKATGRARDIIDAFADASDDTSTERSRSVLVISGQSFPRPELRLQSGSYRGERKFAAQMSAEKPAEHSRSAGSAGFLKIDCLLNVPRPGPFQTCTGPIEVRVQNDVPSKEQKGCCGGDTVDVGPKCSAKYRAKLRKLAT